jgi:hypothetical protein
MSDNIVDLTFSDFFTGGSFFAAPGTANYSGTIQVNYTARTASGSVNISDVNGNVIGQFGQYGVDFGTDSAGNYVLMFHGLPFSHAAGTFTFSYTGQRPVTDSASFTLPAAGIAYSTSLNPVGQQQQPVIATVAPAPPIILFPTNGADFNNNRPVISGIGEVNDLATIYINGSPAGTTPIDAMGHWSFTPTTALADGPYTVKATETDGAGNVSGFSDTDSFTVDTHAPIPTLAAANARTVFPGMTVHYLLSFSEPVFGVPVASNFTLTTTGSIAAASITDISAGGGPGTSYTISVAVGSGFGTIELDLNSTGTNIEDAAGNLTRGATGAVYLVTQGTQSPPVHPNDLTYSSTAGGFNHFIDYLNFEASYADLIHAFGTNQQQMQDWYSANEPAERRIETFDGLDYIASYNDLINAFRPAGSMHAVQDAGATHFIANGLQEGRSTTFNGLDYIASYGDLIAAFGVNNDAGAYHYIENGQREGRTTTFDGLDYIASYGDLIRAFGTNEQAGAAHYIGYGSREGRTTTFDGLAYIAQYTDLMNAFGANNDAGASHYINNGLWEGRSTAFDVAGYEQAHPDLLGQYASNDAFLTAYINTYTTTGHVLT